MISASQAAFLRKAFFAAENGGHIFPGAAAAEAAVESAWGTSGLCLRANNLFGLKKSTVWTGPTISIDTREFLHGEWVTVPADWPVYASWAECMHERMATLQRVTRYAAALACTTAEDYITEVSRQWATGPERGLQVLQVYHGHLDLLS